MKREEKTALSRQRILSAAMKEFSEKGYDGASLNTVCAEHNISKGIIYHYFKDKDELYISCVKECFDKLTACLRGVPSSLNGTIEDRISSYFDARLRFFADNPLYMGIFAGACFNPIAALNDKIAEAKKEFDELNVSVLTELLKSVPLRNGLSVEMVVEDFRLYMDYFNLRFKAVKSGNLNPEEVLRQHEERCHRQVYFRCTV